MMKKSEVPSRASGLVPAIVIALLSAATAARAATPVATITAPASVNAGQAGYAASVPAQPGVTYVWSITNGAIVIGTGTDTIVFTAGAAGALRLTCTVTGSGGVATGSLSVTVVAAAPPRFDLTQALNDFGQRTTLAFAGLGMITGNLEAQSFFPPGKVADYWGFQYLRDNDPDDMGHNTSFLTRAACNVLALLTDEQLGWLRSLASSQVSAINQYGYDRYPLMKAFRRLLEVDLPTGSTGLSVPAVKAASRDLYRLDGQISFDRAVLYARIFRSLSGSQKRALGAMAGQGWGSWPPKTMDDVRERMKGLSPDESVAVMTYAGDLFSWYVGSVAADVYFCPERHGTYFGSFYMKDAPAIGHEGYAIDEQLTATAGSALCDPAKGYVTASQAAIVSALVDRQRSNLYAGATNMVRARTAISAALRSLITPTEPSEASLEEVRTTVLQQSGLYGELDGENVAAYATAFAAVNGSLGAAQSSRLLELRRSFMTGTYADGTPFDFTVCRTPFLYAAVISDPSVLAPVISDTDGFFETAAGPSVTSVSPSSGSTAGGTAVTITGTGFSSDAGVTVGGSAATDVLVRSATAITCVTPAGRTGPVAVAVTTSAGTASLPGGFTYTGGAATGCTPDPTVLCIDGSVPGDRRFRIQVEWLTSQGGGGSGKAAAVSTAPIGFSRGGIFWFFDASNPEMLVKVLNGCAINRSYWVFTSAGTNVGFTVTVSDTAKGATRTYTNPDLAAPVAVQDVAAFSCD